MVNYWIILLEILKQCSSNLAPEIFITKKPNDTHTVVCLVCLPWFTRDYCTWLSSCNVFGHSFNADVITFVSCFSIVTWLKGWNIYIVVILSNHVMSSNVNIPTGQIFNCWILSCSDTCISPKKWSWAQCHSYWPQTTTPGTNCSTLFDKCVGRGDEECVTRRLSDQVDVGALVGVV